MMNFPWNQSSSQKMYTNVSISDDEIEKYNSSDSEGDAFITQRPSPSRRKAIISHLWSAALGCLVAVLVGLVLIAYTSLLNVNITQGSVVPDFPIETIYWKTSDDFSDAPSPATNQAWDLLLPREEIHLAFKLPLSMPKAGANRSQAGDGFIVVANPADYGLRPGGALPDGRESYGISMYHQIHCLRLLRDVYWSYAEPDNEHNTFVHGSHRSHGMDHKLKQDNPKHVTHCFDYLRKAIQCAGDMSIEHASFVPFTHVDGDDAAHKCKSWSSAQAFMHKNAAPIHNGKPT